MITCNAAHAPDRAPQSAPIAKKIHEDINRLLSRQPGYRAATDTEFADLIWEGVSKGGPTVELRQCYSASLLCNFWIMMKLTLPPAAASARMCRITVQLSLKALSVLQNSKALQHHTALTQCSGCEHAVAFCAVSMLCFHFTD